MSNDIDYEALEAQARRALGVAAEMGCEAAVQLKPQEFIELIAKAKEADELRVLLIRAEAERDSWRQQANIRY